MDMRVTDFCKLYSACSGMPMSYYCESEEAYSTLTERLSLSQIPPVADGRAHRNPDVISMSSHALYGVIKLNSGGAVVIGPIYSASVTEPIIRAFMLDNAIPSERLSDVGEYLQSIPQTTYYQLLGHLVFAHYCLNGEKLSITEYFARKDTKESEMLASRHANHAYELRERRDFHNTYHFEKKLYAAISAGDTQGVKRILHTENIAQLKEGKMADIPIRQAKNVFIGTVTKIGMLGAIPGGMDVEQTYQLIDLYVRRCEAMNTENDVTDLYYAMLLDFCARVADIKMPKWLSGETGECVAYIRNHVNEPISILDVAASVNRSASYISKKLKAELGVNVSALINRCKLEEAKSLLTYTSKSLSEISAYLCFSSQSYFQNVFKRKYGVTPSQYRKRSRVER